MNVLRLERNTKGKDYVVGDIHGMFTLLEFGLSRIGFDPEKDRLFSVGDLVDRGAESLRATDFLDRPWFYAVRGNHEEMAINTDSGDWLNTEVYLSNGGAWFLGLSTPEQNDIAAAFSALPYVIDVAGDWGIVHAEPVGQSWQSMCDTLEKGDPLSVAILTGQIQWGRERIKNGTPVDFPGIRRIYCGHTTLRRPILLGNVAYIDTGAAFGRALTIVEAEGDGCWSFPADAAKELH